MTDNERLQLNYEKAIQLGVDLKRAIEAHCRGENAELDNCRHHSKMLNLRLRKLRERVSDFDLALKGQ